MTIGGVVYTSSVLANLTAYKGRSNIYSQPQASYANLELLETAQAAVTINLNDAYIIEVQDSAGSYVTIARGKITDIGIALSAAGRILLEQRITVLGVGRLSTLPKITTTGVLAQGLDGAQMIQVLGAQAPLVWADVTPSYTWATYSPAAAQWYDILDDIGTIDSGNYTLAARASSVSDVYSLAVAVANSGGGYLYENAQGQICYADGNHRKNYIAANGFVNLTANTAAAIGIKTTKKLGDVRNTVTVKYGAGSTSSTSLDDLASVRLYGSSEQIITTTLLNLADASEQAIFYLSLRATPLEMLESITFDLESPSLGNTARDALLNVFIGMPVDVSGLPSNMASGRFQGFVEGWTFNTGFKRLSVTLYVSPLAFSIHPQMWSDVSVAELYSTLSPTLDYAHATVAA